MTQRFRRPTLLAVLAQPGDEALAPAGTLAVSAWRGVRTVLVTLHGANDSRLRAAVARSAFLLSVESHFHFDFDSEAGQESGLRLARILRSFQPGVLVTNQAAQAQSEYAWALASDKTIVMPGLALFEPNQSRLWRARLVAGGTAHVNVSAARALLRAVRFYYTGTTREAILTSSSRSDNRVPFIENFDLLQGRPVAEARMINDLFAELIPTPSRKPITF